MMHQTQSARLPTLHRRRVVLIGMMIAIVGTVLWVLSNLRFVPDIVAGIFAPTFALIGLIITLSRFLPSPLHVLASLTVAPSVNHVPKRIRMITRVSLWGSDEGGILVYARKAQISFSICLCHDFVSAGTQPIQAACIAWQGSFWRKYPVAVFSPLKSGNYTVYNQFTGQYAHISVFSGNLSIVDWR